METSPGWKTAVSGIIERMTKALVKSGPDIAGAVLIIAIGWLLARLMRYLAARFTRYFGGVVSRRSAVPSEERARRLAAAADALGSIVFWFVILVAITAAAQVLGLDTFLGWISTFTAYLPTLLTGLLIILAGYVASVLFRDLVAAAASTAGERQRALLGRAAQTVVLTLAVVVGADQIGIKVTFLVVMVTLVAGSVLGGAALAMSLGARTYVANLIGSHVLRRSLQPGLTLKFRGQTGRVLDVTLTAVVLETDEGRVSVPARLFLEEPMVVVMGGENHGGNQ